MEGNSPVTDERTDDYETDVLVIGGGFAGSWAALRAATLGARVILVDKA
jgi:succinate dehydrogenase/fumarate reductase flavoprotein subunit